MSKFRNIGKAYINKAKNNKTYLTIKLDTGETYYLFTNNITTTRTWNNTTKTYNQTSYYDIAELRETTTKKTTTTTKKTTRAAKTTTPKK